MYLIISAYTIPVRCSPVRVRSNEAIYSTGLCTIETRVISIIRAVHHLRALCYRVSMLWCPHIRHVSY